MSDTNGSDVVPRLLRLPGPGGNVLHRSVEQDFRLDAESLTRVSIAACRPVAPIPLLRCSLPILRRDMRFDEGTGEPAGPDLETVRGISDSERYSRQVLFGGIGEPGQRRLLSAHAAIVGCGATGAAAASLLARAGVGRLTIIDRDFVEPSNLQRQVLFDEEDARVALPKAEAARRHIRLFNSSIEVRAQVADLVPENVRELLTDAEIVLDATDNFETRYLVNDFCVEQGKPWIYAAAIGGYAATTNILPTGKLGAEYQPTACLACLFPKPPAGNIETCDTSGILSTAVNLAASIQVTEALKYLTGHPEKMRRTLLSFELWTPSRTGGIDQSEIAADSPDPDCVVCGGRTFSHLEGRGRAHIGLCGRDSVQIHEHHRPVDFAAMRRRLERNADVEDLRGNDLIVRFRRGSYTVTVFGDGRAIVQGTTDVAVARTLYARFVGA